VQWVCAGLDEWTPKGRANVLTPITIHIVWCFQHLTIMWWISILTTSVAAANFYWPGATTQCQVSFLVRTFLHSNSADEVGYTSDSIASECTPI
jgi:hypothetical protein